MGVVGENTTKVMGDKPSKGAVDWAVTEKQWWDCGGGSVGKSACCVSMQT